MNKDTDYVKISEGDLKEISWKLYHYKLRSLDRVKLPSHVQIEPTTRCNLNCIMCRRGNLIKKGYRTLGDMSFENFKRIVNKIPSIKEIHLHGAGESLLNKDILEMISYSKSKGIKIFLITNGTLIGSMAEEIVKSNLDIMRISFYGITPKTYGKIMRNSDIKKVIKNIKTLNKFKKIHNSNTPKLELGVGAMWENLHELPRFPKFAKKLGMERVVIGKIFGYRKPMTLTKKVTKVMDSVRKNSKKYEIKTAIFIPKEVYDYTKTCISPWVSTYITWDGYVKPCCTRTYLLDFNFGNVLKGNFEEIWNSKKYVKFRKSLKSDKVPLMCKGCHYDFSAFNIF